MLRNPISLSIAFLLSLALLQAPHASAYTLDEPNHTLSVAPGDTADATTKDLNAAFTYLVNRADKSTKWYLKFAPGNYYLLKQMFIKGLQNVDMLGNASNPAKMMKDSTWNATTGGENLMSFTFGKGLYMTGFQFYGQTSFASDSNPVWPDQGVYFGSCNWVTVKNNGFYNFGNAALRVTTDNRDPIAGVNSFNTMVANNVFNNIYQVSTTSNDDIHGATANYTMQNNSFYNVRGSVKFASRTDGAKNVKLLNNQINGSDNHGFEINNYSDFTISGNTIQNIKNTAITVYNNPRATQTFNWGDNFNIISNTIDTVSHGIRFSVEPYEDGTPVTPHNVSISSNTIRNLADPSYNPAISQVNGQVLGLTLDNNQFSNILRKKYITYTATSIITSYLNNTVDGLPYGPQQTTATTP